MIRAGEQWRRSKHQGATMTRAVVAAPAGDHAPQQKHAARSCSVRGFRAEDAGSIGCCESCESLTAVENLQAEG